MHDYEREETSFMETTSNHIDQAIRVLTVGAVLVGVLMYVVFSL